VEAGLHSFAPVSGRLQNKSSRNGALIIDDTYNANPDSVRAAIAVLARVQGKRWLVLGDMGEVGDQGTSFHREIGEYARESRVDRLFATGDLTRDSVAAFGPGGAHFASAQALIAALDSELAGGGEGLTLLVKGSRFMRMERVVAALTGAAADGAH
jgi:UDP-N-acetylmuramoyl-tripeptide--D-alanyl-D-alanine ligase